FNTKGDDPLEISTHQLGLYDAYSPAFNHLHSHQEVETWFREYHFEQICLTRPVRFINKKDITLNGECGGSINMRGVRTWGFCTSVTSRTTRITMPSSSGVKASTRMYSVMTIPTSWVSRNGRMRSLRASRRSSIRSGRRSTLGPSDVRRGSFR